MATNTLHDALCITLNLFKNLRLRIAIVRWLRSPWRQPNISKHTSTVSCDLYWKFSYMCCVFQIATPIYGRVVYKKDRIFIGLTWLKGVKIKLCKIQKYMVRFIQIAHINSDTLSIKLHHFWFLEWPSKSFSRVEPFLASVVQYSTRCRQFITWKSVARSLGDS